MKRRHEHPRYRNLTDEEYSRETRVTVGVITCDTCGSGVYVENALGPVGLPEHDYLRKHTTDHAGDVRCQMSHASVKLV